MQGMPSGGSNKGGIWSETDAKNLWVQNIQPAFKFLSNLFEASILKNLNPEQLSIAKALDLTNIGLGKGKISGIFQGKGQGR